MAPRELSFGVCCGAIATTCAYPDFKIVERSTQGGTDSQGGATSTGAKSLGSSDAYTWTDDFVSNAAESYPINCVDWFTAFAFCIWDGGRLPTEAEWEYAAAGGNEERLYPWETGALSDSRLNWGAGEVDSPKEPVGSHTDGHGRWLHEDLLGSLWEWNRDNYDSTWYDNPNATGTDVCPMTGGSGKVRRGAAWNTQQERNMRVAVRSGTNESSSDITGVRCARLAP